MAQTNTESVRIPSVPQREYDNGSTFQHLTLLRLQQENLNLSKDIGRVDAVYADLGKQWRSLPLGVRQARFEAGDAMCTLQLTIHDGQDPAIIKQLGRLRNLRDKARVLLRSADGCYLPRDEDRMEEALLNADEALTEAASLLYEVKSSLKGIKLHIDTHETTQAHLEAREGPAPDTGEPTFDDPMPEKYALYRAWAVRLPQAQRAMKELGETEDSAMALCLSSTTDGIELEPIYDDTLQLTEMDFDPGVSIDGGEDDRLSIPGSSAGATGSASSIHNVGNNNVGFEQAMANRVDPSTYILTDAQPVLSAQADALEELYQINGAVAPSAAARFR